MSSTDPIKASPIKEEDQPVVSPGDIPKKENEGNAKAGEAAAVVRPTKKPLGVKEVPPFAWKLLGSSAGAIVTLFKSAVREEVEAQHDRVLKDGYYSDLKVVDIDFKVVQPKPKSRPKPKPKPKPKSSSPKPKKTAAVRSEKAKTSVKPAAQHKTAKKKATPAKTVRKKKTVTKKTSSSVRKATSKRSSAAKASTSASKKTKATKSKTKRSPKTKKKH